MEYGDIRDAEDAYHDLHGLRLGSYRLDIQYAKVRARPIAYSRTNLRQFGAQVEHRGGADRPRRGVLRNATTTVQQSQTTRMCRPGVTRARLSRTGTRPTHATHPAGTIGTRARHATLRRKSRITKGHATLTTHKTLSPVQTMFLVPLKTNHSNDHVLRAIGGRRCELAFAHLFELGIQIAFAVHRYDARHELARADPLGAPRG